MIVISIHKTSFGFSSTMIDVFLPKTVFFLLFLIKVMSVTMTKIKAAAIPIPIAVYFSDVSSENHVRILLVWYPLNGWKVVETYRTSFEYRKSLLPVLESVSSAFVTEIGIWFVILFAASSPESSASVVPTYFVVNSFEPELKIQMKNHFHWLLYLICIARP